MPDHTQPICVLLTDARPLVRLALDELIRASRRRMEVVGHATTYAQALELAVRLRPDVILLSFFPDALDGLTAIAELARHSKARLLVLKGRYDDVPVAKAIGAGVHGIVLAEDATESIVRAIIKVHECDSSENPVWVGEAAQSRLANGGGNGKPEQAKRTPLTLRERAVIQAIVANPSGKYISIAQNLGITEHTVHNHLSSIYKKLALINRVDLLVYASKLRMTGAAKDESSSASGWFEPASNPEFAVSPGDRRRPAGMGGDRRRSRGTGGDRR